MCVRERERVCERECVLERESRPCSPWHGRECLRAGPPQDVIPDSCVCMGIRDERQGRLCRIGTRREQRCPAWPALLPLGLAASERAKERERERAREIERARERTRERTRERERERERQRARERAREREREGEITSERARECEREGEGERERERERERARESERERETDGEEARGDRERVSEHVASSSSSYLLLSSLELSDTKIYAP